MPQIGAQTGETRWENGKRNPTFSQGWRCGQGIGLPRTEGVHALVDITCAQKVNYSGCSLRLIKSVASPACKLDVGPQCR